VKEASEIIVVDDGSIDNTEKKIARIKDSRVIYVRHKKNKGKGGALKTGVDKAKNEVILFLDADLRNMKPYKIKKIAEPVLKDEVDLSRAKFKRARGRVTEYAVKPLMRILFPEMNFEQPITGQICGKKEFFKSVDLEKKYGVDIGILFDAINAGQRIIEVDIGKLEHKANSEDNIAEMSRQVLETMIKKAGLIQHKYKLVVLTLDETLINRQTLKAIYEKIDISGEINKARYDFELGIISFKEMSSRIVKRFNELDLGKVVELVNGAPLTKYAHEVIEALKKRKYQVAIVSSNFSPIVEPIAKRLGVDIVDCIYLEKKNGKYTGNISQASLERWFLDNGDLTFDKAFNRILKLTKTKSLETIMVANSKKSIPLQKVAGLSVAYKPKDKELKIMADKTINVLAEILALVE
jgi:HAD superfamily phosphoserine phosphatase-like hydrolase